MKPLLAAPLAALVLLLAGCGGDANTGTESHVEEPPPVTLHLADGDVDLDAWTWCWANGCADGARPRDPTDVGSPAEVEFSFPRSDWRFTATFNEHGVEDCPRRISVRTDPTGNRSWRVAPAGPAGTWDVDIEGAGDGGDVITTFTWTTTTDGALPGPATGSAAVLADHDGELDSYGVEIFLGDLAAQPRRARATVTVTSADGRSVTLPTRHERGCYSAGSLAFLAADKVGRRATTLGAGPFEYVVRVTMDGTTYVGRGTWPDGEVENIAPHVPLTWTPALPAYTG